MGRVLPVTDELKRQGERRAMVYKFGRSLTDKYDKVKAKRGSHRAIVGSG